MFRHQNSRRVTSFVVALRRFPVFSRPPRFEQQRSPLGAMKVAACAVVLANGIEGIFSPSFAANTILREARPLVPNVAADAAHRLGAGPSGAQRLSQEMTKACGVSSIPCYVRTHLAADGDVLLVEITY
jgi:hypothetical protein